MLEEILSAIDMKRDIFWVDREQGEVIEIYYNPDSGSGGQFVYNFFSRDLILEAEKASNGDRDLFYDYLNSECYQELVDIDMDIETVRSAAMEFMSPADFEFYNTDIMEELIKIAKEK